MTSSRVHRLPFDRGAVKAWAADVPVRNNWPVVYTIENDSEIYVGETVNAGIRIQQHLDNTQRQGLKTVRVIIDREFNKSVCLDLESRLIQYFAADGKYRLQNANHGITDADYFDRERYRELFDEIFAELLEQGVLTRSIPDIVNSELFKYSPFKALNSEQAVAVEGILEKLLEDWSSPGTQPIVVEGEPGTGKTIVAIYLLKLLRDIAVSRPDETLDADSIFSDFFQSGYRDQLSNLRIGVVVPQQSLRKTVQKVFARTPGLSKDMVLNPFDLGKAEPYDVLIVDEAHRLGQRANQSSAAQNTKFAETNERLFGRDDAKWTQLDWVLATSRHQIFLVDTAQSIKPGDLPTHLLTALKRKAESGDGLFRLASQMRVAGGANYISFIGDLLNGTATRAQNFGSYELRMFSDLRDMQREILERNRTVGLARLVAGYAWPWVSKKDKTAFDIDIDGLELQWNQTATDWINSPNSIEEVGSIHTVQGYDLNYAGVIIGPDLGYDAETGRLVFHRENYHDKKGKENNPTLGLTYSDEDLLGYVTNIYRVLLTRGIRGTFVYVCDPALRAYFKERIKG